MGTLTGNLVTEKTLSMTGEVSSMGELVGSVVGLFVGEGEGGSLSALHCGDHIALSLQ